MEPTNNLVESVLIDLFLQDGPCPLNFSSIITGRRVITGVLMDKQAHLK